MKNHKLQQELDEIKKLIQEIPISKEVFNRSELLVYLNISESFLYKLTSQKLIPHYKPTNGTLFFLKEEIIEWIKKSKIYTIDEAFDQMKSHNQKRRKLNLKTD